ncbi:adenine deaminase [Larkinella soli]|uniref:adenine deaminase n=1 Tax=Larkinella soli TaxID=1770527 RepID=UPI000FFC38B7|nr:adenine deaminase C-terminal domain-containing protein [Larkinella soli]
MQVSGNLLNIFDRTIRSGRLTIEQGRIYQVEEWGPEEPGKPYLLPGFIDAHVHIESSLLTPAQFARMAVVHGTVATVSDPHEIGNVLGIEGVEYMIEDGKRVPFKFCFGAPSCVPATTFETAGAAIGVKDIRRLLGRKEIGYLAEMMNFPGVLHEDPDVMAKIALAKAFNKPVDGHAPGLRGDDAQRYIDAGMETDHECFTYEEALDKVRRGMHILIREGSAAKNFEALIPLLSEFPGRIMFCSDDKHPDSLLAGHIDQLVRRALEKGHDRFDVLRAACLNPVLHYRLPVGLLREGDPADFIVVNSLEEFAVRQTYINGEMVAENGVSRIPDLRSEHLNRFACSTKKPEDFRAGADADLRTADADLPSEASESRFSDYKSETEGVRIANPDQQRRKVKVIEALDGQLITRLLEAEVPVVNGHLMSDPAQDVLKIAVVNRYREAPPAVAFIRNFGLRKGAMASSVGHDSHNIIAVGCNDESLGRAVNLVIGAKGGLSAVGGPAEADASHLLALPIAGLMTDTDGYRIAEQYTAIDRFVKQELGSTLTSPFMTLSFMALLVIPSLKISDLGLFDGQHFAFTSLTV